MKIDPPPVTRVVPVGLERPTSNVVSYEYESWIPAWINRGEIVVDHGLPVDRNKGNMIDILI